MRRTGVIISTIVMLAALALPALAAGPAWPPGPPPPHGHMLLLASGGCVDLASNQVVPRNAHHSHLHVATSAGNEALTRAGHSIIPTSPITPFADCAALLAAP